MNSIYTSKEFDGKPIRPPLDVVLVGNLVKKPPPRQWLLGTVFCRGILSGVISAGAGGKTTFRILQALSLAINRELTGDRVHMRCRVMIVCLEDDMDELERRVWAALMRYDIAPEEIGDWLILTTPRGLRIAERDAKGVPGPGELYGDLEAAIARWQLDLVMIDPAIKAHGLDENKNTEMDVFAQLLVKLAQTNNIAIDLLSHERKSIGAEAGDVNRQRGASSLKDAARLVYTLTGMDKDAASSMGIEDTDRRNYFRIDSAKVNIAAPDDSTRWFKLIGVEIGNSTDQYPNGDTVQTCEVYEPPAVFAGLTPDDLASILSRLSRGMGDGYRYSVTPNAQDKAAWKAVHEMFPFKSEVQCKAMIKEWMKNRIFEIGEYTDPQSRSKTGILSAKTAVVTFD